MLTKLEMNAQVHTTAGTAHAISSEKFSTVPKPSNIQNKQSIYQNHYKPLKRNNWWD